MSIVLGIDIGNDKCVVAFVNKSGVVDVLQNEASKREIPVVVRFDKTESLFGSAAAARAIIDPKSTIYQLKRLIGLRFDDPSFQKVRALLPYKTPRAPNGDVLVKVRYMNEDRKFTAVELLGMFLCYLKRMAEKATESTISECVIGIPSYFTDQQRRDYLLAAEVAGLKPLRLFHDGAATALDYGIYRNLPYGEEINVVFVDIGHGDTQVTVVKFCFGAATVLAHSFDPDLGGRDFDDVIYESFAEKFEQRYHLNVRENPKATFRLRTACEKAKKVLSSNSEAQINIECFVGDNDLVGVITGTEFENLSSDLLKRIIAACKRALVDADLIKKEIHSVELVGSGSRIPMISNVLGDFFGRETSRTLNGSECIANGCALQCAMLNRAPGASIFGVLDRMPFSVIEYTACKKSSTSTNIIRKGSFLLTPRMLRLHPSESVTISYGNSEDLPCGVSQCITCYKVASENADEKYDLEMKVQFDIHGIITIKSDSPIKEALKLTELFCSEKARPYSDSPIDESSLSQELEEQLGEIQTEGDKVPACAVISGGISATVQAVTLSEFPCGADIEKALENAHNLEMELMAQDQASERAKNCRNDLEAYIYRKRDELSRGLGNLASDSCRDFVSHKLNMTANWLDESSGEEPEEAYNEKMHELKLDLEKLLEEHKENKKKNDFLLLDSVIHETRKLHNLLHQIASRCREAESRSRPDSAFPPVYNKATSLLSWNPPAAQMSLPGATSAVASEFSAGNQQLNGTLPQAIDATSLTAALEKISYPDIEMTDVNDTVIATGSNTSNCQTSATTYIDVLLGGTSSMPTHSPRIDNRKFSGSSNCTQERNSQGPRLTIGMKLPVGLDIGNSKCVVAASTNGVVDAVLNEESKRETPSVVHFAKKHRLFGTAAASCATAYPASTISQIKRLVWLRLEGEKRQNERLLLPYETVESDYKRVSVKVHYLNEDRIFTAVDMLAMLFAQLKRTAGHANDPSTSNCVIGVPSYFNDEQKDAYRYAALIAGWNPLGLLHEGVATALEYATERSDDDAQSVVAFVDIGHCDTQITVVRFRGKEMTVLGEVGHSNLGGRDFDEVIFQHFMGVFEKQYGRDIRSDVKACVRLRTACEKAKRVLSENKEAGVSIDYLMEGVEYASGVITRDKFEELSEGLLREIGIVFSKVLEKFHVDVNHRIESVELVGSGSRIPAISRILTRLFERDLSRTLNGSECVARGCALLCEMLMTSPEDPFTKELIRRMEMRVALSSSRKTDTNFLSKSISQETELQNQDRSHERAKDKRSDLESYIYEVRKERNARTTTEAHEEKISEKLKEIEEWLYGEGDNESEDVYVKKLKHLKSFIHRPPVLVDVPSQQAAVHSRKNSASDLKRGESSRRKSLKTEDMPSEIGIVEENNSNSSGIQASSAYTKPDNPRKKTSNEKESRTVTEPSNSEQEGLINAKATKTGCSMPQTKDLSEGVDDPASHTYKGRKKATKKTFSIFRKLPSWFISTF